MTSANEIQILEKEKAALKAWMIQSGTTPEAMVPDVVLDVIVGVIISREKDLHLEIAVKDEMLLEIKKIAEGRGLS